MDLSPFTNAGLLQREVADIVGVCRATVNRWYRNQTQPHTLINKRLGQILERVEQAVDDGDLPLNASLAKDERMPRLRKILDEEQ